MGSGSFKCFSSNSVHRGMAMDPRASAASWRTMGFSLMSSSTRASVSTAASFCSCPSTYATSCFNRALEHWNVAVSASTSSSLPRLRSVNNAEYRSNMSPSSWRSICLSVAEDWSFFPAGAGSTERKRVSALSQPLITNGVPSWFPPYSLSAASAICSLALPGNTLIMSLKSSPPREEPTRITPEASSQSFSSSECSGGFSAFFKASALRSAVWLARRRMASLHVSLTSCCSSSLCFISGTSHPSAAMAPRASAASCRTMGCSSRLVRTFVRKETAVSFCI
mmetsp:Transcript_1436/g.2046  ORF Transcript_1436/g.2046 Transcript_1436/m.2046 type:complete len:281 (-) Transcript_1436:331-1173(-)